MREVTVEFEDTIFAKLSLLAATLDLTVEELIQKIVSGVITIENPPQPADYEYLPYPNYPSWMPRVPLQPDWPITTVYSIPDQFSYALGVHQSTAN